MSVNCNNNNNNNKYSISIVSFPEHADDVEAALRAPDLHHQAALAAQLLEGC